MKNFVQATRFLTIVPLGNGQVLDPQEALGKTASWFPVVGLGIGVVLVLADRVTGWLFPASLAAVLTVSVWKLLTGGLHLDGLADCLDGLAGHNPSQRLHIMRDSRIGAFGAVGVILLLLLEVAAIAELSAGLRWRALLAAPVIARATPVLLARWFPAARTDGQGATFRAGVQARALGLSVAAGAVVAVVALGAAGLVALAAAWAAALGLGRFLTARLGGITGDVLGAGVETAELVALLTVSAWAYAGR